jgi:hypothetical protein
MARICTIYAYYMQVEFIGCSSSSDTEPWHTAWPLSSTTARVDIQYLRLLVEHGVQEVKRECTYIGHATSKRKYCGM